jgi:hypothetical protein
MTEPETTLFGWIVCSEALTTPRWKKYFSDLINAGITTIEDLLATSDEILDSLKQNIPMAPLDRI